MVLVGLDLIGVCFSASIGFSSFRDDDGVLKSQCSIHYFLPQLALVIFLLRLMRVGVGGRMKMLDFSEGFEGDGII